MCCCSKRLHCTGPQQPVGMCWHYNSYLCIPVWGRREVWIVWSMKEEGEKARERKEEKGGRKRSRETNRGRGRECQLWRAILVSEHANLWTSTVASFISLPDPITTDGVSYSHGGHVGEATTEVEGGQPGVEISSAATAPLSGGRDPGDCSHDAGTSGICTCAASCVCVCVVYASMLHSLISWLWLPTSQWPSLTTLGCTR